MIVIFGWDKQTKSLGEVGRLHCFECKRRTPWAVVQESEWVTLFFLRVLNFSNQHHLHCTSCGDGLRLAVAEFKQVDRVMRQRDCIAGTQIHDILVGRIEKMQLAGKTATQIKFIRESLQRAEQERRAAGEAQRKG